MNPLVKLTAGCLLALVGLILALPQSPGRDDKAELLLYCAASARRPIEELAQRYKQTTGVAVRVQYGGSNTLLSQIEVSRRGDLFLSADASYLNLAKAKGLCTEAIPLAAMHAVVALRTGAAKNVRTLAELLDHRIAAGNPEQTAIGKAMRECLEESSDWRAVDQAIRARGVYKPTVNDVANDVLLGAVDAGVMWDVVAKQYPGITAVSLPELAKAETQVAIGVLESSNQADEARRFAAFLASAAGQVTLQKFGYAPPKETPADE